MSVSTVKKTSILFEWTLNDFTQNYLHYVVSFLKKTRMFRFQIAFYSIVKLSQQK